MNPTNTILVAFRVSPEIKEQLIALKHQLGITYDCLFRKLLATTKKTSKGKKETTERKDTFIDFIEMMEQKNERYYNFVQSLVIKGFPENIVTFNLEKFLNYWSEKNSRGKMRYQLQPVFEVPKRLATWFSNVAYQDKKTINPIGSL